jgi:fructose transport system permease protein
MAFGQIVMTKLAVVSGVPAVPAILIGIATCVGFGMLNGALVTVVRLPAFIVTLGTLNIAFALTHIVSNDMTFSPLPSAMLFFGRTFTIAGADFTYGVVLMLLLYALAWFALSQTGWGRHVYAVGDNRAAARLTGIKTDRVLFGVYTLAGLTSGIAAMLLAARTELGDPNAGQTTENLDSITAVVLGGTSLFGGRGTVIGTLIGAMIVGVFRNGLTLIGVQVIYQYLVTGILVILAVSVDQLMHRRER